MATTSLGRLTLDLVAQVGQFTSPLDKAERKARDSSKKLVIAFQKLERWQVKPCQWWQD